MDINEYSDYEDRTTCSSMLDSSGSFYQTPFNSPNKSFTKLSQTRSDESDYIQKNDINIQYSEASSNQFSPGTESICTLVPPNPKNDPNHSEVNANRSLTLANLSSTIQNIAKHVEFIQLECLKIQKQLSDLVQQLPQQLETLETEEYSNKNEDLSKRSIISSTLSFNQTSISNSCNSMNFQIIDLQNKHQPLTYSVELSEDLKNKLRKLPAMVKGYLVRRLMVTEKVSNLRRTIQDTSNILLNFKYNLITEKGKLIVTQDDVLFHKRLCVQLEKSCKEFYSIFFNIPIVKQMQMIAKHREHLRNLVLSKRRKSSTTTTTSQSSTLSRNSSFTISYY